MSQVLFKVRNIYSVLNRQSEEVRFFRDHSWIAVGYARARIHPLWASHSTKNFLAARRDSNRGPPDPLAAALSIRPRWIPASLFVCLIFYLKLNTISHSATFIYDVKYLRGGGGGFIIKITSAPTECIIFPLQLSCIIFQTQFKSKFFIIKFQQLNTLVLIQ